MDDESKRIQTFPKHFEPFALDDISNTFEKIWAQLNTYEHYVFCKWPQVCLFSSHHGAHISSVHFPTLHRPHKPGGGFEEVVISHQNGKLSAKKRACDGGRGNINMLVIVWRATRFATKWDWVFTCCLPKGNLPCYKMRLGFYMLSSDGQIPLLQNDFRFLKVSQLPKRWKCIKCNSQALGTKCLAQPHFFILF